MADFMHVINLWHVTEIHRFMTPLYLYQMPLKEQQGPEQGTTEALEQMSSKDIAIELTSYDWELFTAMHEVTLSCSTINVTSEHSI